MEVPLTVDGRQQLVALSTIRRLELGQVLLATLNLRAWDSHHIILGWATASEPRQRLDCDGTCEKRWKPLLLGWLFQTSS